jgi:MraZ protein
VFLGEDTHSLDEKGRVVLPRRYRDAPSDGCIVAKGEDHQLLVFTHEAYERKAAEVIAAPNNRAGRRVRRIFFSGADEQGLDKAGRLLLKSELRDYAGLTADQNVKVLGLYGHIELWNESSYADDKARGEEVFTHDEEDDLDEEDDELE